MERSSFFNAELKGEEFDRVYLAEDYARYFASFIGNGVFPNPSNNLQVVSIDNNMVLRIKPGKAWINGYYYENTEEFLLNIDIADGLLNRIDRIVVRLDLINREIKIYIKKGQFSNTPEAPLLIRNSDIYELALADIKINKGVTKINQADILDLRQVKEMCGLVKGTVEEIDTTELFKQFEDGFNSWFNHIKNQLSDDAAGNLQNQIDTWLEFKKNGGTVGGGTGTTITPVGIKRSYSPLFLRGGSNSEESAGVYINEAELSPEKTNSKSLGNPGFVWKDIWLNAYSKTSNGYSKLPNGMIIQWGIYKTASISGGIVNYNIAFPNACISVLATPQGTPAEICTQSYTNTSFAWNMNVSGRWFTWVALGY